MSFPDTLKQATDWNGGRSSLAAKGLTFAFTYYGDAFFNPAGGVRQGSGYDGRFGAIVDADLDKLTGWTGAAFHASIHGIHGDEFSASHLDNMMLGSGIEAPPSIRLFNLWIEQKLGTGVSLRAGQFTAAQEFETSQNANLFVNSTFGWPVMNAANLPSGGPAYPEATPGIRLQYKPNDQLTIRGAVFDGDPAGPGFGNPVARDPNGLAFRLNDPPFFIAEIAYSYGQAGGNRGNPHQEGTYSGERGRILEGSLPGTVVFGGWYHSGTFSDVGSSPIQHQGDYAIYAVLDQMLWRVSGGGDRGLSLFFRGSLAPSDRNIVNAYVDGGFTFKGLAATRPDDTLGLAIAFGHISDRASNADRQAISLTGIPLPVRDFEAAVELTYQWKVAENWFVQPNLQYIIHPGGNIANPVNPASSIPDALVIGMRTVLRF